MHDFHYQDGELYCEGVSIRRLALRHGTPLYVYSQGTLTQHVKRLAEALEQVEPLICFAVKSNSSQAVLNVLARQGCGFDIVSQGELSRVIQAGGDPARCVFAGVGKTGEEIEFALRQGIYAFNVESEPELLRIDRVARRVGVIAPVAVRVNPNIDAGTHSKITTGTYENKFGIAFESIEGLYRRAARLRHIRLRGLQMHIGSQLTEVQPFERAVRKVIPLARCLAERHGLEFLSIGGGLGIVYQPALVSGVRDWWASARAGRILTPAKYAAALVPLLKPLGLRILIEPGRFISGNAGVLVTRVEYVKTTGRKRFVIVDAAMNDLIRPAFYDSYHEIVPVQRSRRQAGLADVVGPICESGDYFAKDRKLPRVDEGEFLALLSAGAYGSVMASNYNSRPLAAEVLVDRTRSALIRTRQPLEDLWRHETLPPWLTAP